MIFCVKKFVSKQNLSPNDFMFPNFLGSISFFARKNTWGKKYLPQNIFVLENFSLVLKSLGQKLLVFKKFVHKILH